jgi:hypothetical protein
MQRDPMASPHVPSAGSWSLAALLIAVAAGCPADEARPVDIETTVNGRLEAPLDRPADAPRKVGTPARLSARGEADVLRFTLELRPNPPELGAFFEVITHVTGEGGEPVEDAVLTLDARMPGHGHGMNTRPAHRPLGGGRYLSEGMRFHMPGRWKLMVEAATESVSDRAEIVFVQPP